MAWYDNDSGLPSGARVESFCIDNDDNETDASAEARLINRLRAQFGNDAPTEFTYFFASRKSCFTLAARVCHSATFCTAAEPELSFTYHFETGELEAYADGGVDRD